jgi:glutamine cyclotransferase
MDARPRFAAGSAVATAATPVPTYGYLIVDEYPHDPEAFTEGLVYLDDTLFEGTGRRGQSELRRVDLESGEVLQSVELGSDYFGEGIVVLDDRIYQITWQEHTCFVYDRDTFEVVEIFDYPTEGWGLTTDGERLIMSDGTNRIYYRDPETFEEIGYVDVEDAGVPVVNLNELESVEGELWANVWQTDLIARIDPDSGNVIGWIDLTGLLTLESDQAQNVDVLNGIAYDAETGRIFVTGKLWPTLFEIEVVPT